jgi:hypothetical protein
VFVECAPARGSFRACIRAISLKASMAPAVRDSDSDASIAELSPRKAKFQAESPDQQSDRPSPEESEEEDSEVYEIEAILDAKRGATGSVRFLKDSLKDARSNISFKDKNRLLR